MVFCIITHVIHGFENEEYFAYSPYVREMNIWTKYVDKLLIVAPIGLDEKNAIHINYNHKNIDFLRVKSFNFLSFKDTFLTLITLPKVIFTIYKAMKASDHIHLRCPGNMGLLGCIVQILFPKKSKTAKYAGNWDLNAKQPLSYKLQKWILSNTFLTKNMKVLVYGEWKNSSINVKPFFTATYYENEKEEIEIRDLSSTIKFLFVGSLTSGKRPLYVIQICEKLKERGVDLQLEIFGEGIMKQALENYIIQKELKDFVFIRGNKTKEELKEVYKQSHFLVLPSKSEGWPKVVAEAMFWGCLPLATDISCIANMLDNEKRGLILSINIENDVDKIYDLIKKHEVYENKIKNGLNWSRTYTLDFFETEIKKMLS